MGLYEYLVIIGTAVSVSLVASALWTGGLWRKCRSLELRCADLEEAHLSLRNKGYAKKRWADREALEAELSAMGGAAQPKQRRFDNDPLEF